MDLVKYFQLRSQLNHLFRKPPKSKNNDYFVLHCYCFISFKRAVYNRNPIDSQLPCLYFIVLKCLMKQFFFFKAASRSIFKIYYLKKWTNVLWRPAYEIISHTILWNFPLLLLRRSWYIYTNAQRLSGLCT